MGNIFEIILIVLLIIDITIDIIALLKKRNNMTTKEVAALCGVGLSIAARWAKANSVERVMSVNGTTGRKPTLSDSKTAPKQAGKKADHEKSRTETVTERRVLKPPRRFFMKNLF